MSCSEKLLDGELKAFFLKNLDNKEKHIISICSNFDVNSYQFVLAKRFSFYKLELTVPKTWNVTKKVLINLSHKSFL